MEEKERYEIHIYDDICVDLYNNGVLDKSINDTYKLEKLLNKKDKRIKELQQQLAEHNEFFNAFDCKDFNEFKDFISTFMLVPHEEQTLIRELKQRLSEKDKEIESLKENWNVLCDYLGECIVKYDEIDTNGIYSEVLEKVNKLKKYDTSIAKTQNQKAIEQLEKEKEIERLKKEIKEPEEIWNAHLAELKEKVKQKLAQEFTEKINEMLKEKVEENQQLKQSQNQVAISELEKLREYIVLNDEYDEEIGCNIIETFDLIEGIADKIKLLKGE